VHAKGGSFKQAPGGGFFRLLVLEVLLRLPFDDNDGALRFLEGAVVAGSTAGAWGDISRVLLCERFLDLVVGPVARSWSPRTAGLKANELLVLTADVDDVIAAILRARG